MIAPASAQTQAPAGTGQASDAELDRLFALMLRDPTNLDLMFQ